MHSYFKNVVLGQSAEMEYCRPVGKSRPAIHPQAGDFITFFRRK